MRVVVTEEVVVWCVEVVVAGDGDDDRMGLLGESGASSRLAARSLFWLTPKRRSPARDEIVAGSLPFSARWTVGILILRVYVVDYCSVVGVLFFAGTESVFYLMTAAESLVKGQQRSQAGFLSFLSRWRAVLPSL